MMKNPESKMRLSEFKWINQPRVFSLESDRLILFTDPETDFWQQTYYGFRNDNAHAFLCEIQEDFTFTVKTEFETTLQYDQCGILLYQDNENWMKASAEYEDKDYARLGAVVTNLGYSDWATTDIPATVNVVWYRLSRRSQDFYLEFSYDGKQFQQMRMFHMHHPIPVARTGIYACSPLKSSFKAVFSAFRLTECKWEAHE
jgi:regulation of enolase protein 1 (concanavalin A-like superfamily)